MFELAQISCKSGGWTAEIAPSANDLKKAEERWIKRSYTDRRQDAFQCGGCKFFAAVGTDFGICWNEKSNLDGCITFEHGGCDQHSSIPVISYPLALQ
jgi:hypothetical protein